MITRASKRHSGLIFRLITDYPDGLYEELKARRVDLLVRRRTGKLVDDQLDFQFLFNDRYVVAADRNSPWFRRRNVKLADLIQNASWVLAPEESVTGSMTQQALQKCGLGLPKATVVAGPVEVRMNLMKTGRFLSIFSNSALTFFDHRHTIKKLPVTLPGAVIENGIFTLKGRTPNLVAHRFMEWTRAVAKPLAA